MDIVEGRDYKCILGDCLEIMPTLEDGSIDLICTDPPYLFNFGIGGHGMHRTEKYSDGRISKIMDFTPGDFLEASVRIMKSFNFISFCSKDQIPYYAAFALKKDYKFDLHIWHKLDSPPFINGTFKSDVEYIVLIYEKGRPFIPGFSQSTYSKVYSSATNKTDIDHPTVKPIKLMRKYISILSNPAAVVFDPFAGSFTTGVACLQTGRKFVGIEKERQYFDIGVKRMHDAAQHVLLPGM